ncbi:hypothetical protein ACFLRM_06355, partial [Acidobacteriota bacterium]
HMLIGNHEEMNITGIAFDFEGYITVEQFLAFLPKQYIEKKEKGIKKEFEKSSKKNRSSQTDIERNIRETWGKIIKEDKEAQLAYLTNFNKKYGKWIMEQNAIIKINDIIFVHGGIDEEFSGWQLKEINDRLRKELKLMFRIRKEPQLFETMDVFKIIYNNKGPLWYRDLARSNEELMQAEVERILHNLNAEYIVIGHTPLHGNSISGHIRHRFQGRIWVIDTGISEHYGNNLSALIIEKGEFFPWGDN